MPCLPTECEDCIGFHHSAGPSNCDPCQDLGGEISECVITDGVDNLFHSIGPKLTRMGHEDYRCFYIRNDSEDAVLRNVIIYFNGTGSGVPGKKNGTYVALGVKLQDEIQQVTVTGLYPPNNGEYFKLKIPDYDSFKVFYDPNITKWVGNFQSAIRAVEGFPEVVVTSEGEVPTTTSESLSITFTVNFGGHDSRNRGNKGMDKHARWMQAARHQFQLMEVEENTLLGCVVSVIPVQDGSPVNTVAEVIGSETTSPAGIPFDYFFRGNPCRIGDLRPGDFLPLWIKRTLPFPDPYSGALAKGKHTAKILDNFQITVEATSP